VLGIGGKSTLFPEDLATWQPGEGTNRILAPGERYNSDGFSMGEDGKDVRSLKVS
jgi:hypothetical protein